MVSSKITISPFTSRHYHDARPQREEQYHHYDRGVGGLDLDLLELLELPLSLLLVRRRRLP